jgi:hypothetical protein
MVFVVVGQLIWMHLTTLFNLVLWTKQNNCKFTTKMLSSHSKDGCPCIMVVDSQNSSSQLPSLHISIGKHAFLLHNNLNNEQRSTNVHTWYETHMVAINKYWYYTQITWMKAYIIFCRCWNIFLFHLTSKKKCLQFKSIAIQNICKPFYINTSKWNVYIYEITTTRVLVQWNYVQNVTY